SWAVTPTRLGMLKAAGASARGTAGGEGRGTPLGATVPTSMYATVLHDPKLRDPRGYIIPSAQDDFSTATKFVNALLKTGITVMRSTAPFEVAGKKYGAGTYVIKTAQAFRPHVLDMFEPQDHPNDFRYPGGPPIPPYDITGWTLALQMGVKFDRVLDEFDGPFTKLAGLLDMPGAIESGVKVGGGAARAVGYRFRHRINNSFVLVNRLLKAGVDVYWLKNDAGAIWVPASSVSSKKVLDDALKGLG